MHPNEDCNGACGTDQVNYWAVERNEILALRQSATWPAPDPATMWTPDGPRCPIGGTTKKA